MSIETKALAEKAERLAGQKTLLDWIGSFGSEDIGVDTVRNDCMSDAFQLLDTFDTDDIRPCAFDVCLPR